MRIFFALSPASFSLCSNRTCVADFSGWLFLAAPSFFTSAEDEAASFCDDLRCCSRLRMSVFAPGVWGVIQWSCEISRWEQQDLS